MSVVSWEIVAVKSSISLSNTLTSSVFLSRVCGELGDCGSQIFDLTFQHIDLFCLFVTSLLVCRQLRLAPSMVLGLLCCFLLQLAD